MYLLLIDKIYTAKKGLRWQLKKVDKQANFEDLSLPVIIETLNKLTGYTVTPDHIKNIDGELKVFIPTNEQGLQLKSTDLCLYTTMFVIHIYKQKPNYNKELFFSTNHSIMN